MFAAGALDGGAAAEPLCAAKPPPVANGEDDFERLVGIESTVLAGEILVVAGDSSASYLIKKMRGSDDIFGDVMPPGGLDEEIVQSVANWIDAGAAKD